MSVSIKSIVDEINRLPDFEQFGTVSSVLGMLIEVDGIDGLLSHHRLHVPGALVEQLREHLAAASRSEHHQPARTGSGAP